MAGKLEGRKALVTGARAASGAASRWRSPRRARTSRSATGASARQAEEVVKAIEAHGPARRLASRPTCATASAVAAHGATARATRSAGLDIVVANAGVPTRFEPVHEVDPGLLATA